ncbi:MAG: MerR family transcriptional regulator [Spirulinaceae cyanobacterium SM2_1_0]|nr:MerR family transcriptional regulator [Spirulinaceae cyanobacterium SM2_1_0]
MLIGELAQRAGVSKDTIRLYEKMGLLTARDRPAGSRFYKEYEEAALERLELIQCGKNLGFTLNEIKQFLDECQKHGPLPVSQKIVLLERKLTEIAEKIQNLRQIETYLLETLGQCHQEQAASEAVSSQTVALCSQNQELSA